MSAAPTHRKGSMPKNGGPMRQPVSHHGTKPKIVPGATMKNTSDPSEAQKRRMVIPNERATRLGVGWYTLDRHLASSGTFSTRAHKAEHAVDLEAGAIVGATVQGADHGDTTTIAEPVTTAAEDLEAVATVTDEHTAVIEEVVADKGYHSNQVLVDFAALDLRTYIAEPDRGRR